MSGITNGDRKILQALIDAEAKLLDINTAFAKACVEQNLDKVQADVCKARLLAAGAVEVSIITSGLTTDFVVCIDSVTERGHQVVYVC